MINEFLTLTKDWHPFFSFFTIALIISILGFALVSIIFEISKFFCQTLPIIIRGWPNNSEAISGASNDEETEIKDKK